MNKIELKDQLIGQIHITEDLETLEFVLDFLRQPVSQEVYSFSDAQLKRIELSLQQIKDGEVFSEEEANKIVDEWMER
jgi:predicted transcriptional regulator